MAEEITKQEGDLPWTYAKSPSVNGNDNCYEIHWSNDGECVAEVVHGERAAEFICRSANNLNELRHCLIWALDVIGISEKNAPNIDWSIGHFGRKARALAALMQSREHGTTDPILRYEE